MKKRKVRRRPDRTSIPGFVVDALVHAPYGSFPHECYGLYEADFDHFGEYAAAIDAAGSRAVAGYLDRYVYGPATYGDYLDRFGRGQTERLETARAYLESSMTTLNSVALLLP